ncbi:MGT2 magnesium transporter, partial [Trypanosoma conorhini]
WGAGRWWRSLLPRGPPLLVPGAPSPPTSRRPPRSARGGWGRTRRRGAGARAAEPCSARAVSCALVCFTCEAYLPNPTGLISEVDCIDEMVMLVAPGKRDQSDLLRRIAVPKSWSIQVSFLAGGWVGEGNAMLEKLVGGPLAAPPRRAERAVRKAQLKSIRPVFFCLVFQPFPLSFYFLPLSRS